jgi:hypothetical protein
MSDLAEASTELAAGLHDDARVHAWNASRTARHHELAELGLIAAELHDPALAAAVTVRRLRRRHRRYHPRWSYFGGSRVMAALGFAFWVALSTLFSLALVPNGPAAVVAGLVAGTLLTIGVATGWIEPED